MAQLKAIIELQWETVVVIEQEHQLLLDVQAWEKDKKKDDDTSAHQREERTPGCESKPKWGVVE